MHQNNIISLLDSNALFLLGDITSQRIAICLKEKKENNKERKESLGGGFLSEKAMCENND
jgi:hypothetical protein